MDREMPPSPWQWIAALGALALVLALLILTGCGSLASVRLGREIEAAKVRAEAQADVLKLYRFGCTLQGLQGVLESEGLGRQAATERAVAAWVTGGGLCPGSRVVYPLPAPTPFTPEPDPYAERHQ